MTSEDLVDYYSRRASEYESVYEKPERQVDLRSLTAFLTVDLAGLDVLEIACGTGWWTERIAGAVRRLLATDASDEVLAIARRKFYPRGRVRFARADAFALDSIPGQFTAAFLGFWWSHVPRERLAAFLDGLHRRLGAGARVVAIDNRFVEGSSTPVARIDEAGNSYQRRTLADGSEHEVVKNFPTADELHAAVHGIAENVTVTELTYYWMLSYRVTHTQEHLR